MKAAFTPGFRQLNINARSYFLDTNVWSALAVSPKAATGFFPWLIANNAIAALSIFTVLELSRATNMHQDIDKLIASAAQRIYIPLLYDELSDLEMYSYPNEAELLWIPITSFAQPDGLIFLSTISKSPPFIKKRQEYLDFGNDRFMKLEELKKNFPFADGNGKYPVEHADRFARATTLDFLVRYFPEYLLPYKNNLEAFDTSILKSIYVRSLFLYFKYYVHGQSPIKSDFMDFAHVSYSPYFDAYVTERNVLNVLSHMQKTGVRLQNCEFIHIRSFVEKVERSGV